MISFASAWALAAILGGYKAARQPQDKADRQHHFEAIPPLPGLRFDRRQAGIAREGRPQERNARRLLTLALQRPRIAGDATIRHHQGSRLNPILLFWWTTRQSVQIPCRMGHTGFRLRHIGREVFDG
jgi:hypothetical protein